jgi:hypothetical protein
MVAHYWQGKGFPSLPLLQGQVGHDCAPNSVGLASKPLTASYSVQIVLKGNPCFAEVMQIGQSLAQVGGPENLCETAGSLTNAL